MTVIDDRGGGWQGRAQHRSLGPFLERDESLPRGPRGTKRATSERGLDVMFNVSLSCCLLRNV